MPDLLNISILPVKNVPLAVAVSGGVDSMTLIRLLTQRLSLLGKEGGRREILALTVDHGLRPESAAEVRQVGAWMAEWGIKHHILKADEPPPMTRIQEWARTLRYRLMADFCAEHNIAYLAVAHHADDQAETLLFRLSKGSGLEGLGAMRPVQKWGALTLLRPFLAIPKARLVAFCVQEGIAFIQDPSNVSPRFARARLRRVLAEEGMTAQHLSRTAIRLARAADALQSITDTLWAQCAHQEGDIITLNNVQGLHFEIVLRLLRRAIDVLCPSSYGPRLDRLEALTEKMMNFSSFQGCTLGGVMFTQVKKGVFVVKRENARTVCVSMRS